MTLVDRSLRRQFTAAMALAMALALLLSGTAHAQTTADAVAAVAIDDSCNDVPEDGFPDVPETNTFDDEIECLKAYGITIGKADGTYDPSGNVPRWQMALFIYRLALIAEDQIGALTLPAPSPEDSPFTDLDGVDPDAVDAIDVLNEIGVVEGTTATTYSPGKAIRRDQMASFINRLQGAIQDALGGDPAGFTTTEDFFPDDTDNVHEDNINGLASVGVVQGKVTGKYNPAEKVNRGQMSAFIMRHVEVNVDNGVLESAYPPAAGPLGDLTDAPELQTVEIANTDEGANEALLTYTFDESLLGGGDPVAANFHVVAPDGDVDNANSAARDGDDLHVINAVFDLDLVERATAAAVSTAAVTDVDDALDNPEADFPLQALDIAPGDTAFPDLTSVENFDADNDTVDFVFDEDVQAVDGLGLIAGDFNLIPVDGGAPVPSLADAAPDIDGGTVTVPFADITSSTEADTARGDVIADTVEDTLDNDGNLDRTADVSNDGNTDDNPDLESFSIDAANDEATFTFDVVIADASVDPGSFYLHQLNGDVEQGQVVEGTDGKEVTIGFLADAVSDAPVAAFVDAGAVDANAAGAPSNEADSATRGLSFDAGDTLAPNLVSAEMTETKNVSGDVTAVNLLYTFDDDVDAVTANTFIFYNADGEGTEVDAGGGDTCDVSADDDTVVECEVTSDLTLLDDAVLATIENNAVVDVYGFEGHPENAPID